MSGLHLDAAPKGYLTVYPEGFINPTEGPESRTWNAGSCCSPATNYNSNDAEYLLAILNDLESTQNIPINTNKIFFTGHSNGGRMTYRMACQYPTLVAAIAPNGGMYIEYKIKPYSKHTLNGIYSYKTCRHTIFWCNIEIHDFGYFWVFFGIFWVFLGI
eukprot:454930_1